MKEVKLKDTLKAFDDFKMFFNMWKYVYSEIVLIPYTMI